MKTFKKTKNLSISNTIQNFKDKITLKKSLKEISKGILVGFSTYTILGLLILLILGATITLPSILFSAIYVGVLGGFYLGMLELHKIVEKYTNNKQASKEIDNVLETIKQNDIDIKKEEINTKVEVTQLENSKGFEYLDNGKYKKSKRVINYITINTKDKYKVIKEVITYVRNVFYKEYSSNAYIMNDQDLVIEGFIDENGKLTEKGKLLNLKTK